MRVDASKSWIYEAPLIRCKFRATTPRFPKMHRFSWIYLENAVVLHLNTTAFSRYIHEHQWIFGGDEMRVDASKSWIYESPLIRCNNTAFSENASIFMDISGKRGGVAPQYHRVLKKIDAPPPHFAAITLIDIYRRDFGMVDFWVFWSWLWLTQIS